MAEWTKPQADEITALYKQLKGEYEREADQKLFGGPQLPYEQAKSILDELFERQNKELAQQSGIEAKVKQPETKGLEAKTSTTPPYLKNAVGLAATLAGIALLGVYFP